MNLSNLPEVLTTKEVADLLRVSVQIVKQDYEHFGGIRFTERIIRYPRSKVELLLGGFQC